MKSRFFLLILSVLITTSSILAQDGRTNFTSVNEAAQISKEIIKASGMKANFDIRQAKVPNAAAVLYGNKRYILYNPDFISKLTHATGTKWAAISVLAHEIGHHLNRKSTNGKTSLMATELEADEFSGYVLQKMGASLQEAQAAMKLLGNSRATRTHPAGSDRLASIAKGFETAGGSIEEEEEVIVHDEPVRRTITPSILDTRNIVAEISFNADPNSKYYVTTAMNVVKVKNEKLYMIGKMEKLNSRRYPFVMYDANKTQLFVTEGGEIVNRNGKKVGSLSEA